MIIVAIIIGLFIWSQAAVFMARDRDNTRKKDINAIYYTLQTMYYPAHHSYPLSLSATSLPGLDPAYLKDPHGYILGDPASDLRYEPTGCNESSTCSGYTLRAALELEADFVKTN